MVTGSVTYYGMWGYCLHPKKAVNTRLDADKKSQEDANRERKDGDWVIVDSCILVFDSVEFVLLVIPSLYSEYG